MSTGMEAVRYGSFGGAKSGRDARALRGIDEHALLGMDEHALWEWTSGELDTQERILWGAGGTCLQSLRQCSSLLCL